MDYAGVAARLQRYPDLDTDDVWRGLAVMESEMLKTADELAKAEQEKREREQRDRAQHRDFTSAADAYLESE